MSDKKVDGIKKLDKEELKKSRQIVLDAINETEKQLSRDEQVKDVKSTKLVDGLTFRKEKVKPIEQVPARKRKDEVEIAQKVPAPASFEQVQAVKQVISEAEKQRLVRQKKQEILKKKEVEKKRKEELKRKEMLAKRKEEIEKEKRKLEKERIDESKRFARKKKAQASIYTSIMMLRQVVYFIKSKFKAVIKIAINALLFLAVLLILFYVVFAVLLLKFNVDNPRMRQVAELIVVPAIVTKQGMIDYYTFKDTEQHIKASYGDKQGYLSALRDEVARYIIIGDLLAKYDLDDDFVGWENLYKDSLSQKIVEDPEVNQVAINRIDKIEKLIAKGENFIEVASKYGDEQNKIDFSSIEEATAKFGAGIAGLEIGKISEVITASNGYYIFRRYEKEGGVLALSYVFIGAKTLDAYLSEEITRLKMWSFIDFD